ncbi:MAG TPA: LytTR family DNA-binding domain-containing protein [Candidatus Olsenella pullicola]|nr:LytTR family DNA-binding domain-containing protein [Candidatus Olsenella pullicola]
MLDVAVIEDDPVQLELLASMVEDCLADEGACVERCAGPDALVECLIQGFSPELLVADIVLGEPALTAEKGEGEHRTAIDLVKRVRALGADPEVVYVTGYEGFHTRAYETDHACFLLKPVDRSEMEFALGRVLERLRRRVPRSLVVRMGASERLVRPDEIVYLESNRRVVRIHLADEVVEAYGKLGDYEKRLDGAFVRCHKSFLVNIAFVSGHRTGELVLSTGDVVPVSQSRRRATQDALLEFLQGL